MGKTKCEKFKLGFENNQLFYIHVWFFYYNHLGTTRTIYHNHANFFEFVNFFRSHGDLSIRVGTLLLLIIVLT